MSAGAKGYTIRTALDDSRHYDCVMCAHSAPSIDAARAHHAVHVAGPDMLEALRVADHALEAEGFREVLPIRACVLAAIAKAEPQ